MGVCGRMWGHLLAPHMCGSMSMPIHRHIDEHFKKLALDHHCGLLSFHLTLCSLLGCSPCSVICYCWVWWRPTHPLPLFLDNINFTDDPHHPPITLFFVIMLFDNSSSPMVTWWQIDLDMGLHHQSIVLVFVIALFNNWCWYIRWQSPIATPLYRYKYRC